MFEFVLVVLLSVDGKFNSYGDIKFTTFNSHRSCVRAGRELKKMITARNTEIQTKCIEK